MQQFIRNTAAAYLLALILFKVLAVPLLFLNYELNKDLIAANFCENKARPAMQCNGKCHLSKQLAKAAETPASSEKNTAKLATVDFVEHFEDFFFEENKQQVIHQNLFRDDRFTVFSLHSIFHPPATIA